MEHSSEATEHSATFPEPIHGHWDLDDLVRLQSTTEGRQSDIPRWMQSLSEAEANRAFSILINTDTSVSEKKQALETDFSRGRSLLSENPINRQKIIRELLENLDTRNKLRGWLCKHGADGLKEAEGVFVKKPTLLRVNEQKHVVKPNLRRIFSEHFDRIGYPHAERTLVDIGTWDGELPRSLQPVFGHTIGIEMNEERFTELLSNPQNSRIKPIQGDIVDIIKSAALSAEVRGDAYLMSHLLYFLRNKENGEEHDMDLLQWVLRQLSPKGIGVVVLNDTRHDSPFNSRDGVRKHFGIRETNPPIDEYAAILERKGITTRIIRPSLRITGRTPDGKLALKDVIRFLIPGEARSDDRKLEQYVEILEKECDGEFLHTLSMLVLYKDPATAPEQPQEPLYPVTKDTSSLFQQSIATPVRASIASIVSTAKRDAPSPAPAPEQNIDFSTYKGRMQALTAAEMLDLLDRISRHTDGGEEDKLQKTLEELGMARTTFFRLMDNQYKLRKLAEENPSLPAISVINARSASVSSSKSPAGVPTMRRHPSRRMERRFLELPMNQRAIPRKNEPTQRVVLDDSRQEIAEGNTQIEAHDFTTEASILELLNRRSEMIKSLIALTERLRRAQDLH